MKITIFGTGYVGLVTGACLAQAGYEVTCVDIDAERVAQLEQGVIPIYEPGLEPIVKDNVAAGNLVFTTSAEQGVAAGECIFIAVGTPPDEDGSADLSYVLAVAEDIGRHMDGYRLVVNKSTVPVGTVDRVRATIEQQLKQRDVAYEFDVVSNPEFLKEGSAVRDFTRPDRIVLGTDSPSAAEAMQHLYAPFNRNRDRVVLMDPKSAELTKYAANAMLATKISFMNEMANLAERLGADIQNVRVGIGSDPRIGYDFIYAGCGYGGSCFPKDVRALQHMATEAGYDAEILHAVESVNVRQKRKLFDMLVQHFGGAEHLKGKTIAVWGLAFKPNTDDMRDAPSRELIEALWEAGVHVQAFDPQAMGEAQRIYGYRDDFLLAGTKESALRDADALVICTEWKGFMAPDFDVVANMLRTPVIFDGRNLYDPARLRARGFTYYGIGRP